MLQLGAAGSPATGLVEGHRTWNPLLAWFPLLYAWGGGGCRAPAFHFCIADAAHLVSTFVGDCWNDAAHLFSTFVWSTGHCNWRDAANLSFSKQNHIIFQAKSYHFRNKIISFSKHFGVTLGSLWGHFGVPLGSL